MTDTSCNAGSCEDQFLIADLNKSLRLHQSSLSMDDQTRLFGASQGKLLLITDGSGSTGAGERASTLAVDAIAGYLLDTMRWIDRLDSHHEKETQNDLREALQHCQEELRREGGVISDHEGMGVSLTMAYVVWPKMYVVHAGDTRCYLLRNSVLMKLTHDHTIGEQMVDEGLVSTEQVESRPESNILWNVIGGDTEELRPEIVDIELQLNDKLLLATDGLHKHVQEHRIGEILNENQTSEALCWRLISEAITSGSRDAVTSVIAHFDSNGHSQLLAEAEVVRKDNLSIPLESSPSSPATPNQTAVVNPK